MNGYTPLSFGHSEWDRVKMNGYTFKGSNPAIFIFVSPFSGYHPENKKKSFLGANSFLIFFL